MPTQAGAGNFKVATTRPSQPSSSHATTTTPTTVTRTTTNVTASATATASASASALQSSPSSSPRQSPTLRVSSSDYSTIEHVAMRSNTQLTYPASSLPPPNQTKNPPHSDDKSMAAPSLSPRSLPLPPSPPFQYDFDNDNDDANDSDTSSPPPAHYYRPETNDNNSRKPVIHQQSLPFRATTQPPSTPSARPHTSSGIAISAPMQRAHSSPGVDSLGRFITPQYHISHSAPRRPASPLSAGSRRRSPLRSAMEESYPSWSGLAIEPNIPEHAELDLSEDYSQMSPIPSYHTTFPRSRRRPASPLHPSASAPSLNLNSSSVRAVSPHTTGTSSPGSSGEKRYYINEAYPTSFSYSYSSASSMPSTPSSLRSRSPSISSLETIEDSPDAEEAAMNAAEEDAKYRVEEAMESGEVRRRASLEIRGSTLRSNKERKRWSVCGAERRADFSLEVIEE